MRQMTVLNILMASLLAMSASGVARADDGEMTTGRALMNADERQEHRQNMRTMNAEEREQYRKEHHEQMKERAREQGRSLPDEPMERGKGMMQGQGMGRGPGGGPGMGGGGRR